MSARTSMHGMWSSHLAFVLAVTGSAVGLGNIWKFPYMAGANGGGVFVVIYLLCVAVIGLPIMMSEVLLGRRGRRNPIITMRDLGQEESGQRFWSIIGYSGVLAGILILSYYSVIAGWAMAYLPRIALGVFQNASAESVAAEFGGLIGDPERLLAWHSIFMVMTVLVVARGVEQGLERAVRFLMPALFILLLVMVGYAATTDGFGAGLAFLFSPDFSVLTYSCSADGAVAEAARLSVSADALTCDGVSHLNRWVFLSAMGQAFFSLSLGMGAVMTYGAYLPQSTSILSTSVTVVAADTAVAILAGVAIFPIVFANGLDPAQGPGLIFQTLPLAFGQMGTGGVVFGTLFFLLLVFAGWTSSIGLIEPAVAWLVETRGMTRAGAAWSVGGAIWAIGFGTIASFNLAAGFTLFGGRTIFDMLDYITSNVMLPLGGLLISVFAGWVMCRNSSTEELAMGTGFRYSAWRMLARFVAPAAVALIFLSAVGLLG
jgi:neurotransmitter:Na+ symporter, NSS family